MIPEIVQERDELFDAFFKLSTLNYIENVKEHIEQWRGLATLFAADERYGMSANCMSRVKYWSELEANAYVRIMNGVSFSELVPADYKTDEEPAEYDWQNREDLK